MASDARIEAYADAMFEVARAEGTIDEVEDELFRFARALEGSDELRTALTDPHIPASRRQQIVEDLLGPRATSTTTALVSMKGVTVPIDETVESFELICDGGLDDLPEQAFLNVGNADAARAKAKQLEEGS